MPYARQKPSEINQRKRLTCFKAYRWSPDRSAHNFINQHSLKLTRSLQNVCKEQVTMKQANPLHGHLLDSLVLKIE